MSRFVPLRAAIWCAMAGAVALMGSPDFTALDRAVSKIFVAHLTPPVGTEERGSSIFDAPSLAAGALERPMPDAANASGEDTPDVSAERPHTGEKGAAALTTLYGSFIALQALDVHSTLRALGRGARESNPMIAPIAERPAAFVAMKAATTAGIFYMTERVRRHSLVGAIAMMAAFNSVYATVVANNYRVGNHLGP